MTINIVCYFLFIFLVTFPSIAATSVTITSIVPNTLKVGQTQPWIVYTLVTSGVGAISEAAGHRVIITPTGGAGKIYTASQTVTCTMDGATITGTCIPTCATDTDSVLTVTLAGTNCSVGNSSSFTITTKDNIVANAEGGTRALSIKTSIDTVSASGIIVIPECELGFFYDETFTCVHESTSTDNFDNRYAVTNGESWYDVDLLKYYNAWDEDKYKDNSPNVVQDIAGVQASFEQQIKNIENSYLDNTPDSRFVQINHEYDGIEMDILGNYDDRMTEAEKHAELERLKALYKQDLVEDTAFRTNGKIYNYEASYVEYERL